MTIGQLTGARKRGTIATTRAGRSVGFSIADLDAYAETRAEALAKASEREERSRLEREAVVARRRTFVNVREARLDLRISYRRIRELVADGTLTEIRTSKECLLSREQVAALVASTERMAPNAIDRPIQLGAAPTLNSMKSVLGGYEGRLDTTLRIARASIGGECDPANPRHAGEIRNWLNAWHCRLALPRSGDRDHFVENIAEWWRRYWTELPPSERRLGQLSDLELERVAVAYMALRAEVAGVDNIGRARAFGPVVASMILWFVRPLSIAALNRGASRRVPKHGAVAFAHHLKVCRSWAIALMSEAAVLGLDEDHIGSYVGRADSGTAALINEWLHQTSSPLS